MTKFQLEILKSQIHFQLLFQKTVMFSPGDMEQTGISAILTIKLKLSPNRWFLISEKKIRKLSRLKINKNLWMVWKIFYNFINSLKHLR